MAGVPALQKAASHPQVPIVAWAHGEPSGPPSKEAHRKPKQDTALRTPRPSIYTQGSPCHGIFTAQSKRGLWLWEGLPFFLRYVSNPTISVKWGMAESPSSGGALQHAENQRPSQSSVEHQESTGHGAGAGNCRHGERQSFPRSRGMAHPGLQVGKPTPVAPVARTR